MGVRRTSTLSMLPDARLHNEPSTQGTYLAVRLRGRHSSGSCQQSGVGEESTTVERALEDNSHD